jgi:hypothetical protein
LEQRQQALTAKKAMMPNEVKNNLPDTYDEMLRFRGDLLKQQTNIFDQHDRETKQAKAEADLLTAQSNADVAQINAASVVQTGLTPAEQSRIDSLIKNVTEPELALRAARGDEDAKKAMDLLTKSKVDARPPKEANQFQCLFPKAMDHIG